MRLETHTMSPSTGSMRDEQHHQGMGSSQPGGPQGNEQGRQGQQRHREGPVARQIEQYTAEIPSDVYLWAAGASMLGSLMLAMCGQKHGSLFVGQWAPTLLIMGLYNKVVKVAGSDSQSG